MKNLKDIVRESLRIGLNDKPENLIYDDKYIKSLKDESDYRQLLIIFKDIFGDYFEGMDYADDFLKIGNLKNKDKSKKYHNITFKLICHNYGEMYYDIIIYDENNSYGKEMGLFSCKGLKNIIIALRDNLKEENYI